MSYCIYCGTKNRDEALFCRNCGKPLSESESKENKVEEPVAQEPIVEKRPAVPEPIVEEKSIVEENPIAQEKPIVEEKPIAHEQRETSYSSTVNVSKPRNKALITIIILIPIILLLAAVVGGAVFLFSASKTIKEEMGSTMDVITHEAVVSQDIEESPKDTISVGEAIPEEDEAEEVSDATDGVAAENTMEATVPSVTSLSTKAKPKAADFQGWFVNGAMKAGKPNGVKTLSSLSDISGSWKAFLFLDPTNRNGEKAQTFGTVTFGGTNERIKVYLKRYYTHFFNDNENMDESSEAPDFFSARWKAGQLIASGVGSFVITDFWEQDGKQYAIGTFSTQDGITASMGLVRP